MMSERRVRAWLAGVLLAAGCQGAGPAVIVGAESAGAAKPIVLASGLQQPGNLVVDDTHVYWSNAGNAAEDGSILSVPKKGGAVVTLATGQNVPFGLAVDDKNVYWTNYDAGGDQGRVVSVPKGGGKQNVLVDGLSGPREIYVDAFNVYFLTGSSLMAVSKLGGPAVPLAPATCGNTLVGDETSLYWVENCVLFPPSGIVKVSKLGGVPVFLSIKAPGSLAVDATNLYYDAGEGLDTINKFVGGLPWPLSDQAGGSVDVDSQYVYWISTPGLVRTPKLGGTTQTIYTDASAQGLAIDSKNIYWFDFGIDDGAILTMPKPR